MCRKKQNGFTIVELLIVVVVIAILAAITLIAYNGISKQAKASAAQSAAQQVAKKIATYAVTNSEDYPADLATIGVVDGGSTAYQYSFNNGVSPRTYCVTVTVSDISYFISNTQQSPTEGGCPGHGQGGVASVTNLVTNPSFETGSSTVEVRRNLVRNPQGTTPPTGAVHALYPQWYGGVGGAGTTTWGNTEAGLPDGVGTYGRKTWSTVPTGGGGSSIGWQFIATSRIPVTTGEVFHIRYWWRTSQSFTLNAASADRNRLILEVFDAVSGGTKIGGATAATSQAAPAPGQWQVHEAVLTAPATGYLSLTHSLQTTAGLAVGATIDGTAALVEKGGNLGGYFDGNASSNPDLTATWVGTVNQSESVLQGSTATGVSAGHAVSHKASEWKKSGSQSIRIKPIDSSNDSFVNFHGTLSGSGLRGFVPGRTYTVVATVRLTAPLSGTLNGSSRTFRIAWQTPSGQVTTNPSSTGTTNNTGEYEIRHTFTVPSNATAIDFFRLYNGASVGNGDVWWDDLMVVEGVYNGPARNGDSPNWIWNGTSHNSTSTGPGQ